MNIQEVKEVLNEAFEESQEFLDWYTEVLKKISYIRGYVSKGPKGRVQWLLEELDELVTLEEWREDVTLQEMLKDPMYSGKEGDK